MTSDDGGKSSKARELDDLHILESRQDYRDQIKSPYRTIVTHNNWPRTGRTTRRDKGMIKSEKRKRILELMKESKSTAEIEKLTGYPGSTVRSAASYFRMKGLILPSARRGSLGVIAHPPAPIASIPMAKKETIEVVTCPHCGGKLQVNGG